MKKLFVAEDESIAALADIQKLGILVSKYESGTFEEQKLARDYRLLLTMPDTQKSVEETIG